MKRILSLFVLFTVQYSINAQVGIGTTVPHPSSAIEITGSDKGMLIPRVALTGTTDVVTIPSPANSLIIYNTVTIADIKPGYYYWSGLANRWTKILDDLTPIVMTGWSLTGNSGMVNGVNFIGTTDNVDVIFKRNNIVSGVLNTTNTIFGVNSLATNTSGINNTAVGAGNLIANTTGSMNTAIGVEVLSNNKSGLQNTGYGYRALYSNIDGNNNVANGYFSLYSAKSTIGNVGIGANTLRELVSGDSNVAVGGDAIRFTTAGRGNTAIGSRAGYNLTSIGNIGNNTLIGYQTAGGLTTGKSNTIIGANVTGLAPTLSNTVIIADGDGNRRIYIDQNGYLGIGTETPKFPLDIRLKTASWPLGVTSLTYYGINPTSGSSGPVTYENYTNDMGSFHTNTSLYTDGNIISVGKLSVTQTSVFSDQRIKNIIGKTDSKEDLELLKKLIITNYQMKDTEIYGQRHYKKVIAQEVESVYPQAVSKTNEKIFIPNVYQRAKLEGNILVFDNAITIGKDDKWIKIYDETGEKMVEIIKQTPQSIVIDIKNEELKGNLFVYGTEVNDVRSVDYDALSMLNISATQELTKKIESLEKENDALKKANNELQNSQILFEMRLKKLEAFLQNKK